MTLGPRFRRLWTASATSNIGDGLYMTAVPLLAASLTRDPLLVSGVTVSLFLPWLLFALPGGALVDRMDRRLAMARTGLFRTLVLGGLTLTVGLGVVNIWIIYLAVFLLGSAETIYESASRALLPAVVRPGGLDSGNGKLQGAQVIAQEFVGPPIAGALFAISTGLPLLLGTVAFSIAALLISTMGGRYVAERASTSSPNLRREIAEGLQWLRGNALLRRLTLLGGVLGFANGASNGVMVLFALEILGLDETGFGLLLAGLTVGSVIGTVVAGPLARRFGRGPALLAGWSLGVIGYAGFGLSSNAIIGGAFFALAALGIMAGNVLTMSIRQSVIPAHLFGRVQGAWRTVIWGAMPVGALAGGALARVAGLRAPFLLEAVAFAVVCVGAWPVLRNLPDPEPERTHAPV
ncbi:MAG TPA: MFS transporter [Acidimicrobiia bacterium]|nr:MFS transporter [Acidimicrobiia bacterium]